MLINLTNHPVETWGEEQLEAASQEFGKVMDLPFPFIDPTAGSTEIADIARQWHQKILSLLQEAPVKETNAVHVMGELSFCFALVSALVKSGIRCIVSTSQRVSETLGDNSRKQSFTFERFRNYIIIA
jgi:hypothetical protein